MQETEQLLTRTQAAKILGLKPTTLAKWHAQGTHGLPFVKCGGSIRYRQSDLEQWINERADTTGSATGKARAASGG